MKLLLIALLLLSTCLSIAEEAPSLYLDIHGLSHHPVKNYTNTHITTYSLGDDVIYIKETTTSHPFNQLNTGIGITYRVSPLSSYSLGSYHNSYYKTTNYALYNHTMYTYSLWNTKLVLSGGVASGYIDGVMPIVIPSIVFGGDVQVKVGGIPKSGEGTTGAIFISVGVRLF